MSNTHHRPDIPAAARGRWPEILTGLGIDGAHLTNKHGPCPGCGGRDRFRFDDRDGRGTWICGGGGDPTTGDGFDLVAHVLGLDKREAFVTVKRALGFDTGGDLPPPPAASTRPTPDPKPARSLTDYARELWARVEQSDSAVSSHPYARAKGIEWAAGAGRGFASGRKIGRDTDCIIVPVRSPDGELCAVECLSDHTDEHGKFVRQAFGAKRDGWLTLGNDRDPMVPRYVVEGWATGARLFKLKGNCLVAVAFGAGRMQEVAEQIERRSPGSVVTICTEAPHAH